MHKMVRQVAKLGLADRFNFTGFLKGDDVHKMFTLSDVYVMPSVSEPFGISPLGDESSCSNHHFRNNPELRRCSNMLSKWIFGMWMRPDAIYGILNYPTLSQMFVAMGDQEVESLKWEKAALKVKAVYESALA